jgi:hypothetical protein
MQRRIFTVLLGSLMFLGVCGSIGAAPSHYPTNPNACVGASSTSANAAYQAEDPDKYRSDQAHGQGYDLGRPGRADAVSQIPQCLDAGLERGNDGN